MLEPEAVTTIVRLGQSGWGAKRIARTLGIARNTVRRYLNAGGPVPYRQPQRDSVLGGHEAWLRERFLQHRGNCDVVRQQLSKELGIDTSLRTVERACRGFRQELEASRRATIRFETAPGEQMQIDFGQTRVLIGGEPVRVFLFVATLGYSRRGFACAFRHERRARGSPGSRRRLRISADGRRPCSSTTPKRWSTSTTHRRARFGSTAASRRSAGTGTSLPVHARRFAPAPKARPRTAWAT